MADTAITQVSADWRDYFPRGVQDPNGPDGEPIPTPTDHRLLWDIEGELSVLATTPTLHRLQQALRSYLNENCQHYWRDGHGYDGEPLRQCLWCSDVVWLTEAVTSDG